MHTTSINYKHKVVEVHRGRDQGLILKAPRFIDHDAQQGKVILAFLVATTTCMSTSGGPGRSINSNHKYYLFEMG